MRFLSAICVVIVLTAAPAAAWESGAVRNTLAVGSSGADIIGTRIQLAELSGADPAAGADDGLSDGLFSKYGIWIAAGALFLLLQTGALILLAWLHLRRKQAEEDLEYERQRYADVAHSSSDWIWEMGPDLRFTYLSPAFANITGVPVENIIGKRREEVTADDLNSEHWRDYQQATRDRKGFRDFVYSYRQPSGQIRWMRLSGNPIFDETGEFAGYRGMAADITIQRETEVLRDAALEEAKRANEAKSRFLAMMSHDFRTPLNAILGFSDIMRNQIFGPMENENYKRYVDDIHISGQHMLAMVEEILDLSAIEGEHRALRPMPLDARVVFEECRRSVARQAEDAQVELFVQPPTDVEALVADRRALIQILLNLLSNAIKFTPSGGAVTLAARLEPNNWVIDVRDTGVGIPKDRIMRVTEPFRQGDQDPYTTEQGHGLGLAIVCALVAAHGGTFELNSVVGEGTTATVILPRETSQEREAA
ncbi:MAG: ATP-binding protein [Alphaproteobacteria bacterium]